MYKKLLSIVLVCLLMTLSMTVLAEQPAAELVFMDAFDTEEPDVENWVIFIVSADSEGSFVVQEGQLVGSINAYSDAYACYSAGVFTNVIIEAEVMLESGNALSLYARVPNETGGEGYQLFFDQWDGLKICKRPYEVLLNRGAVTPGKWYHVKFTVNGNQLTADITDIEEDLSFSISCQDDVYTQAGYVGFCVFGVNTKAYFDNVKVYSLDE